MGLPLTDLNNFADEKITYDLEKVRLLGMHLVEYADRHAVSKDELKTLLRMIGL